MLLIAGITAAAYGAVLAALLVQAANNLQQRGPSDSAALSSVFLTVGTSFIAPLAALLFGFAQFFREIRPDRFALLTHRPVPRGFLFACKAMTGLLLYAVALLVPLLMALAWASNPYNIRLPLAWSMGLAPLSDILAGVPYYFAGVLIAQRLDARWVGSRLLPATAALILSFITVASSGFWAAALVALVAAAGVAIAAESYYAAAGQYARVRRFARPFNGAVLLAALLTVGVMGFALVDALFQNHGGYYTVNSRTTPEILEDGTPVVEQPNYRILDLAGRELGAPVQPGREAAPGALRLLMFSGAFTSTHDFRTWRSTHEPDAYFIDSRQLNALHAAWYAAGQRMGSDYLVGYHSRPDPLVGAIGAHGFEPGVAVPRTRFARPMLVLGSIMPSYDGAYYEVGTQFDGPSTVNLISAGDTLYHLKPDGTLDAILATPTHAAIISLGIAPSVEQNAAGAAVVTSYPVLTTDREAIILSPMIPGKKFETLAHYEKAGLEKYAVAGARIAKTGQFVLRIAPYADMADSAAPELAVYFTPDGGIDHETVLPALRVESTASGSGNPLENYVGPAIAPPAGFLVLRVLGNILDSNGSDWTEFWRAFRLSLIGAAVAGVLAFLLCRRMKMGSAALLWGAVALLTGPAGLVLLLCLRGLPLTIRCAACGKRCRADQPACSACGAAISGPAANGTEIFV